jgi:hypothetical protein
MFFSFFRFIFFRTRFFRLRPGALTQEVLHHLGPPSSQEESNVSQGSRDQARAFSSRRMTEGEPCLTWKYDVGRLCYVILFARVADSWRLAENHLV